MPSPFPGMDPYLEARWLWPDVHGRLIPAIADALAPQVAPADYVAIEERTYVVPAEPLTVVLPRSERVRETYLEVRAVGTHAVVTVIEVLSPTNKSGGGRSDYTARRAEVLDTATSLVEIDLLREGEPMEMSPRPATLYRILVAPIWTRPEARLWAFRLHSLLPEIPVPLREREKEASIPLGKLLAELYDRARYDLRLGYGQPPPEPPLSPEDAEWAARVLRGDSTIAGTPDDRSAAVTPGDEAQPESDGTQGEEA
jgi:hypothetical protein